MDARETEEPRENHAGRLDEIAVASKVPQQSHAPDLTTPACFADAQSCGDRGRGGCLRLQERGPPAAAAGGRRDLPGVGAVGLSHQDDPQGDGPAGRELSCRQGDAGVCVCVCILCLLRTLPYTPSLTRPRVRNPALHGSTRALTSTEQCFHACALSARRPNGAGCGY